MIVSKEFRQMLMQIPLMEVAMTRAWNWLSSLPPEKRERLRSRLGVRRPAPNHVPAKFIPDAVTEATQSGTVWFSIDKARRLLGYEPRVRFADGMKLVEQWLRYAAYV